MGHMKTALRLVLGLIYVVFGLNGFYQFIPVPPPPETAAAFMGGLFSAGYFFPLLKATEVIAGLALLSGFFVPLALVILAPITLQIFLYHFFLAPEGMFVQAGMIVIHLAIGYLYRDAYKALLSPK